MQFDFLTPRVERVSADGRWVTVHPGGPGGRLRPPVILLARELTTFSLFETSNLPRSRRTQAARLHARTGAPYLLSSSTVIRSGADFGIWWWDADRVNALVEGHRNRASGPLLLRPETLAQPPGDGWRIVRLNEGYEAQFWREKRLVACAWRRERFDGGAWSAFTRLQRGEDAPESPPSPQTLPIDFSAPAFTVSASDLSREQLLGAGAAMVALSAFGLSLFFWGQGARLASDAGAIEKETSDIQASTPRSADIGGLEVERRRLAAYAEVEGQTNPLSAAGAAIGIVAFHDLTPTALEAQLGTLTLTLPYSAVSLADVLITDFEGSGYFYDIRPRTDAQNQRLIIEMKTRQAAPPLIADE